MVPARTWSRGSPFSSRRKPVRRNLGGVAERGKTWERMESAISREARTRPGSAAVVNILKKRIRARGVDVGCELYEAGRPAEFERVAGAAGGKRVVR